MNRNKTFSCAFQPSLKQKNLQGVAANMRKKANTSIPDTGGYSSTKHNTMLVLIVLHFFFLTTLSKKYVEKILLTLYVHEKKPF
jgi:hypothetical protein